MSHETDLILRHRCRRARSAVRAACGWCEHCKRTERGNQRQLAARIGVDPSQMCRFIEGRDIGCGFLERIESWMAGETEEEETA